MFIGVKNQQSKSCPSCMLHTFLTWYMSHQKLSSYLKQCGSDGLHKVLTSVEIIIEKVRVLMPTSPYLCLYQILSKHFKLHTQGFSLVIHSGEVTRKQPQQRLSLLHVTHLLFDTNASTNYYQNMSKGIKKSTVHLFCFHLLFWSHFILSMERKILASREITTK